MLVSESRGVTLDKPKRKRLTTAELIERAIENMEQKLDKEGVKASVGDLIRLLQLQKDLGFDQPKQVTVRWVEKNEK